MNQKAEVEATLANYSFFLEEQGFNSMYFKLFLNYVKFDPFFRKEILKLYASKKGSPFMNRIAFEVLLNSKDENKEKKNFIADFFECLACGLIAMGFLKVLLDIIFIGG